MNHYFWIPVEMKQMVSEVVRNLTLKNGKAMPMTQELIGSMPVLLDTQKKFYPAVMQYRYEKVLKKIMEQQMTVENQRDTNKERRCR